MGQERTLMQLASSVPFLERTRSAIDRLRPSATIWPCSGRQSATSEHPAPTKASSRLIVLFRAKISGGRGQSPGQAPCVDVAPASDPLGNRTSSPALDLARTGQSDPSFTPHTN